MVSNEKPEPKGPDVLQVPLVWIGIDEAPISLLNQFLVQKQDEEYIITLGSVAPPVLLGSEEERREQISRVRFVPVRVLGRFGMTDQRMHEFLKVLGDFVAQKDREHGEMK